MKPKVYIETSIPSFYHEVRTEAVMVARREWTQEWWDTLRHRYALVTSAAVVDELMRGEYPNKEQVLALINTLPLLPVEPAISEIVHVYIAHKVMPNDPLGDALHLAVASYHKCDFLVTWNAKHLANANKFQHIRRINALLGLYTPLLVTPLELLGEGEEDER
jgi:predicted nucleic acid-binding protein